MGLKEGDCSCNFRIWRKKFMARECDCMQLDIHAIIRKYRGLKVSTPDSIQLSSSASSFFPSHPAILPLSYFLFLHLLLLPFFPALSSPPLFLDVGARWSSNGVYREPAFTTSEANRQVSSAFHPTVGLSLPLFPSVLLAITAISNSFIRQKSPQRSIVRPGVPRWPSLEFSSAALWCVQMFNKRPPFVRGASETTDLDRDNGSRQADGGQKKKKKKNGRKKKKKTPSAAWSPTMEPLYQHSQPLF